MKIITLHVEESADAQTVYGQIADALQALAEQHFGKVPFAKQYLENQAERARVVEGLYQKIKEKIE